MRPLITWGNLSKKSDEKAMTDLMSNLQKEFDKVYQSIPVVYTNISGTFTSSDGKTVTIANGVISSIR